MSSLPVRDDATPVRQGVFVAGALGVAGAAGVVLGAPAAGGVGLEKSTVGASRFAGLLTS